VSFWTIVIPLVAFPALFISIFAAVLTLGTARVAGDYPAVEPEPGAEWHPCTRVLIGNARLSGGTLDAATDGFGVHFAPSGFCRPLGGRAFSIPWSALDAGLVDRRVKGAPVLETTLPNGQRFAADPWCFGARASQPDPVSGGFA
jgi:hypothetical protein